MHVIFDMFEGDLKSQSHAIENGHQGSYGFEVVAEVHNKDVTHERQSGLENAVEMSTVGRTSERRESWLPPPFESEESSDSSDDEMDEESSDSDFWKD